MVAYLLSLLVFLAYSVWIIQSYYVDFAHSEGHPAWYGWWLFAGWVVYKAWVQWRAGASGEVRVGRWLVPALAVLQVLVACFWFSGDQMGGRYAMVLFFKIAGWSALPALAAVSAWAAGARLVKWALPEGKGSWQLRALLALGSGMALLLTAWAALGAVGLLSGWSFFLLLGALLAVGWRELVPMAAWWGGTFTVRAHSVSHGATEFVRLRELTSEWFFIALCAVLASNLVNIVRSTPIGWDDLGVYMNWPKMIAQEGALLKGGGMFSWQTFTSVGFLLGSPTQAFFLSCLGGVLAVAATWLAVSHAQSGRKSGVDLAMMAAAVLYAMPMVVFQQAKDMKLDLALLAMTVAGAYPLIPFVVSEFRSGKWKAPAALAAADGAAPDVPGLAWKAYALAGFVLGCAFVIKVTTAMALVAAIALLAVAAGGWLAFLGFCFLVAGGFHLAGFWAFMGVELPQEGKTFSMALCALGAAAIAVSFFWRAATWRAAAAAFAAAAVGAALSASPWLAKGLVENLAAGKGASVDAMLSGINTKSFKPDLSAVYSSGQIEERVAQDAAIAKRDDGRTTNEDYGRYFGYEFGMNNYAKLPWNMSMQANQRGEFTDITYLFLVIFPGSLLFLAYRRRAWVLPVVGASAAAWVLFVFQPSFIALDKIDPALVTGATKYFADDRSVFRPSWYSPDIFDISWEGKGADSAENFYLKLAERVRRGDAERPQGWTDAEWSTYQAIAAKYARISFKEGISLGSIRADAALSPELRAKLEALRLSQRSPNQAVTDALSLVELPRGYALLAVLALAVLAFLSMAPRRSADTQDFRAHAFFLVPYCLLFSVVAFAVPWYGIMMYVSFLAMAAAGLAEMTREDGPEPARSYRLLGGVVLAAAVSAYFVQSALPHAANNLKGAGFVSFKAGLTTASQDALLGRAGYLPILSELNLKDPVGVWAATLASWSASKDPAAKHMASLAAANGAGSGANLDTGVQFLATAIEKLGADPQGRYAAQVRIARDALESSLQKIITPSVSERNDAKIFRLGTFLAYFISQNRQRFWEDNLVSWFDRYAADTDPDVTAARLKKMGFSYMLADLNAATIDKDPRHDLTRRYEELLWSFSSRKLELIYTDNLCLKVARDVTGLSREEFLALAGTNYDSWNAEGKSLARSTKQAMCGQYVAKLLSSGEAEMVPSLAALVAQAKGKTAEEISSLAAQATSGTTWMAAFKVK